MIEPFDLQTQQQTVSVTFLTACIAAVDGKAKHNPYSEYTPRWHEYERGYAEGLRFRREYSSEATS